MHHIYYNTAKPDFVFQQNNA